MLRDAGQLAVVDRVGHVGQDHPLLVRIANIKVLNNKEITVSSQQVCKVRAFLLTSSIRPPIFNISYHLHVFKISAFGDFGIFFTDKPHPESIKSDFLSHIYLHIDKNAGGYVP